MCDFDVNRSIPHHDPSLHLRTNRFHALDIHQRRHAGLERQPHRSGSLITGHADIPKVVVASVFDLVPKPVTVESLQDAITRATDGAEFTDPELERAFRKLTESERKITALVVDGKASCEIRTALGISRKTVETHGARIMDKTRADDVEHLARLWQAWKQYWR